jgi:hypothetical protein
MLPKGCSALANYFFCPGRGPGRGASPVPAAGPPAAGHNGCITAEIDATAAWQHDKPGNHPQMLIIFAIRSDGPAFNHESGSDRKALRQTAKLVTHR